MVCKKNMAYDLSLHCPQAKYGFYNFNDCKKKKKERKKNMQVIISGPTGLKYLQSGSLRKSLQNCAQKKWCPDFLTIHPVVGTL